MSEQIQVEKRKHSLVIGPGGSTINGIMQKCGKGFKITIPERSEQSNVITLTGTPEQIAIAKTEIEKILGGNSSSSSQLTDTITIPRDLHCAVIGKGGKNIQEIKTKSGVLAINLPPQGSSDTITIIADSSRKIESAKQLIRTFVDAHEQKTKETDELYQKYNKQTQIHADNRSRYFQQATEAYNRGDKALAAELSQKGKYEQHKMLKSKHHAALRIFKAKNPHVYKQGEIDLHGLHAQSAVALVQIYIHKFKKKGKKEISIICGKGLHSEGEAVIKPSVIEYLNSNSITFQENEPGKLEVKLN